MIINRFKDNLRKSHFSTNFLLDNKYVQVFGKHLRTTRNLSQEDLANDADIPINQIGTIERAEINTTLSTMRAISKTLNIHINKLFDFDD